MHDESNATPGLAQLGLVAAEVAEDLLAAAGDSGVHAVTGGGSRHRGLSDELRNRFIAVRAALFQRGVFNPVLVRFDSATVPQASTREIAEELAKVAAAM
jgi:hypothetical protein